MMKNKQSASYNSRTVFNGLQSKFEPFVLLFYHWLVYEFYLIWMTQTKKSKSAETTEWWRDGQMDQLMKVKGYT